MNYCSGIFWCDDIPNYSRYYYSDNKACYTLYSAVYSTQ